MSCLFAGFVYFLIQININPIGKIPPAYVIKGPVAIDIGVPGSDLEHCCFRRRTFVGTKLCSGHNLCHVC